MVLEVRWVYMVEHICVVCLYSDYASVFTGQCSLIFYSLVPRLADYITRRKQPGIDCLRMDESLHDLLDIGLSLLHIMMHFLNTERLSWFVV